ncbi:GntR family transcriptional regulator [Aestuariibius sp. 2305UL40-4]|uniref:GntR family transcriptional regulator n=1 Tax=Aestuariibius violaceus TaxID=3234132 RepID=UPI00345F05F0
MALFSRTPDEDDTIVSLVASGLRRDISFGVLPPDARLKLTDLRSRYGGSNHSIREALRILSTEGLVEAEAQRGFRVASATEADLADILRLRVEIEGTALDWSLAHGDVTWEGSVIAAHHALGRAEEAVAAAPDDLTALEWDEALRTFHAALAAASGSPRIIALQKQFYDQSRRFTLAALREARLDFAARKARQAALLQSVLDRDAPAARAALTDNILGDLAPHRTGPVP